VYAPVLAAEVLLLFVVVLGSLAVALPGRPGGGPLPQLLQGVGDDQIRLQGHSQTKLIMILKVYTLSIDNKVYTSTMTG